MKFSAVLLFAAGAFAVTPVNQISDGQVQNPATAAPSYPAGNATVVAPTGTGVVPGTGSGRPTGGATGTGSSPSQVSTNAADAMKMPVVGAGLAGIAAMLAL